LEKLGLSNNISFLVFFSNLKQSDTGGMLEIQHKFNPRDIIAHSILRCISHPSDLPPVPMESRKENSGERPLFAELDGLNGAWAEVGVGGSIRETSPRKRGEEAGTEAVAFVKTFRNGGWSNVTNHICTTGRRGLTRRRVRSAQMPGCNRHVTG